jgi:hypothetical protein
VERPRRLFLGFSLEGGRFARLRAVFAMARIPPARRFVQRARARNAEMRSVRARPDRSQRRGAQSQHRSPPGRDGRRIVVRRRFAAAAVPWYRCSPQVRALRIHARRCPLRRTVTSRTRWPPQGMRAEIGGDRRTPLGEPDEISWVCSRRQLAAISAYCRLRTVPLARATTKFLALKTPDPGGYPGRVSNSVHPE